MDMELINPAIERMFRFLPEKRIGRMLRFILAYQRTGSEPVETLTKTESIVFEAVKQFLILGQGPEHDEPEQSPPKGKRGAPLGNTNAVKFQSTLPFQSTFQSTRPHGAQLQNNNMENHNGSRCSSASEKLEEEQCQNNSGLIENNSETNKNNSKTIHDQDLNLDPDHVDLDPNHKTRYDQDPNLKYLNLDPDHEFGSKDFEILQKKSFEAGFPLQRFSDGEKIFKNARQGGLESAWFIGPHHFLQFAGDLIRTQYIGKKDHEQQYKLYLSVGKWENIGKTYLEWRKKQDTTLPTAPVSRPDPGAVPQDCPKCGVKLDSDARCPQCLGYYRDGVFHERFSGRVAAQNSKEYPWQMNL